MYATYVMREVQPALRSGIHAKAAKEFWPLLQKAPGFRGFFLVEGPGQQTLGIAFWESQEDAEAFRATLDAWQSTLDSLGSTMIGRGSGDVIEI